MAKQLSRKGGPSVRVNVEAIRNARLAKGWSQKDLADTIGCDKRVIERIESRGTAAPDSVGKLVAALEIPVDALRSPASKSSDFSRGVFQLPPSLPDFTGREDELARITARLRGGGGSVGVSSALRGMGGIGKTVTAIEACWEVKDDFPDGQLVVELRGMSEQPLTAVQAMTQIIRDFHPETGKLPDDEKELLPLYRRALEGKKLLVLLDDAKDETQVRSLLSVPSVAFVVTSRHALAIDHVESIRLGALPPDAALAMLRGIVGAKGADDELRTVAELCGWLPLALRVAGDFLRLHENWPLPKYITALQDESKRLERLKGKTPDRDVEAVLAFSARELVRENPERAERWQMLSVFPADFDMRAVAVVWDLEPGDELTNVVAAEDELTTLLDRSLVQFDADTNHYSLHDLMRPVARSTFQYVENHPLHAGSERRLHAATHRFASYFLDLLDTADDLYSRGAADILSGLTLFDRDAANIRYSWRWVSQQLKEDRKAADLCRDYTASTNSIILLRLSPCEQIAWFIAAVEACRKFGARWEEGEALWHLGNAHLASGNIRAAISSHELALVVCREYRDWRREGQLLGALGATYAALGYTAEAIRHSERAVAVANEFRDRRLEGEAAGAIGAVYAALGDTRRAISCIEHSLAIAREFQDRVAEGKALGNLGNAHTDLAEISTAIGLYEQQLKLARLIGNRLGEGTALGNLGSAWARLGDTHKAISFYEQRRAIAREVGDKQGEASASFDMALALYQRGQRIEAIRLAEYALATGTQIESPHVETVRQQLVEWRGEATA